MGSWALERSVKRTSAILVGVPTALEPFIKPNNEIRSGRAIMSRTRRARAAIRANRSIHLNRQPDAGVVKLADAPDSKSTLAFF